MTSPSDPPSTASPSLRRLLDETSDLIDSPMFSTVLTSILDAGFTVLADNKIATLGFKLPLISSSQSRVHEIVGTDVSTRLASLLSVFCRQAHTIGAPHDNEYLTAMENVRDLEAFAAVVYSSNFEIEAPDFPGNLAARTAPSSKAATSAAATPVAPGIGKATEKLTDAVPPVTTLEQETGLAVDGAADLEKAWNEAVKKEGAPSS
jgi:peroxin-3